MTKAHESGGNNAPKNDEWDAPKGDPDLDGDFAERPAAGAFLKLQKNLIFLIDEYRETHLVDDKKMTLSTFAEKAGISFFTVKSIVNGHRWVARANRQTVERLASILEIPVIQVYILCEFIKPQDIVFTIDDQDQTLNALYRTMLKDKRMMYRLPSQADWDVWPMSAKVSLCMMYESLREKVFLRYATTNIVVE